MHYTFLSGLLVISCCDMQDATNVGDEGGFAPSINSTTEGLDLIVAAIAARPASPSLSCPPWTGNTTPYILIFEGLIGPGVAATWARRTFAPRDSHPDACLHHAKLQPPALRVWSALPPKIG